MFGALFKRPWRKRLVALPPEELPEQLADLVSEAAQELDRVASVRVTSPMSLVATGTGGDHQIFLYNLLAQVRDCPPADRAVAVEQFLAILSAGTQEGALRDLVPVLKSASWIEDVRAMTLKQSPPELVDKNQIASLPFVADMHIVFAFDGPSSMSFATVGVLQELDVRPDAELLTRTKAVLRERLPPLNVRQGQASRLLTCGGTFESSLLLFDDVMEGLSFLIEGELIALAPARDVLMLTGTKMDGGLEEIRSVMNNLHTEGGQYLLSKVALLRTTSGWTPLP